LGVKIIGTFGAVLTATIALLQPAQGRSQGSVHSFSPAQHYSGSARHFSSRPRNFSGNAARFYGPSTQFSSQAAFRNRAYSAVGPRLAVNRTTALRPQGFNNNPGRVIAQHSSSQHPNWDRRHDHFWHGHRCHWHNNAWVIFDLGFFPWGYGYGYPYGAYPYYDNGYYDDRYASNEYSQSEYDSGNSDSSVGQVQAALAREGYYRGSIDGSLGPATRNALRRYQRNHGLDVTGRIDGPVIEALGLR
jgi:hypothetical protein